MDDAKLLDLAATLAARAAEAIMTIRARGFSVTVKTDASPVTEADHAAEALILAGLRAATPHIPVIAEEEVAAGGSAAPSALFWLVDPLDGTREFTRGTPDFTVHIGLIRGGAAVLGAVALPAHGELFGGIVGVGAWRDGGAGRRAIRVRAAPEAGIVVMASSHFADNPVLAARLAGRRVAAVRHVGSGVKFCRVAEGAADYYPRLEPTLEWDTAAPQAVLEAAGGRVVAEAGGALRYGKPGWRNGPFEVFGA